MRFPPSVRRYTIRGIFLPTQVLMDGETRTADDLTKRTMYNPRLKPLYMSVFCLALVSLLYNKPASSTINRSINRITTSPVHCNYLSMIMFMFPAVPVTKRKASSLALDPRPLKRSRTSDDPRAVKRARTSDATWRSVPPSQKLQSSIAVQRDGEKEPRKGERKMKYLPIDPTKRVEPYPKGKGEYFVLMQRTARLVVLNGISDSVSQDSKPSLRWIRKKMQQRMPQAQWMWMWMWM